MKYMGSKRRIAKDILPIILKDRNKWYSELQVDGKTVRLGSYLTKEESIKARKDGEEKYFKEYKSIINNEIN